MSSMQCGARKRSTLLGQLGPADYYLPLSLNAALLHWLHTIGSACSSCITHATSTSAAHTPCCKAQLLAPGKLHKAGCLSRRTSAAFQYKQRAINSLTMRKPPCRRKPLGSGLPYVLLLPPLPACCAHQGLRFCSFASCR